MTRKLGLELCDLTSKDESIAIAECVDGLGCTVYADGQILAPWASNKVEELVGIYVRHGAFITNQTEPLYFILKREKLTGGFRVLHGPLKSDELGATL